jgi:hypothetical protein
MVANVKAQDVQERTPCVFELRSLSPPETINLFQESVSPFKRSVFVKFLIQAALRRVRCDDKEGRQRKSSVEWTDLNRSKRLTPRPAFFRAVPR